MFLSQFESLHFFVIVIIGASEWDIHSRFAAILAPGHIQLNQKRALKEEAENKEKIKRGKMSLCTCQFWVSTRPPRRLPYISSLFNLTETS